MKTMASQKVLVSTSIKMFFFLFMESTFEQIFLTVSNANLASSLRAFKCQSEIVLFHFGQNKIIPGFDFGFGSFRHFSAWQV